MNDTISAKRIFVSVIDKCLPEKCTHCKTLIDSGSQSTYFICRKTGRLIETNAFSGGRGFPDFCPLPKE